MTTPSPLWVDALTAALVVVGAVTALVGSFGLLRVTTFFQRVHAPSLGRHPGDVGRDAGDRGPGVFRDGATVPARPAHPGVRRVDRAGHHRVADARRAVQGPPARLLRRPTAAGCVIRSAVPGESRGTAARPERRQKASQCAGARPSRLRSARRGARAPGRRRRHPGARVRRRHVRHRPRDPRRQTRRGSPGADAAHSRARSCRPRARGAGRRHAA